MFKVSDYIFRVGEAIRVTDEYRSQFFLPKRLRGYENSFLTVTKVTDLPPKTHKKAGCKQWLGVDGLPNNDTVYASNWFEPLVKVNDVTDNLGCFLKAVPPQSINLAECLGQGTVYIELIVNQLQKKNPADKKRAFLLQWKGTKSPKGAVVFEHIIGHTQHGEVQDMDGQNIGSYDRIVAFGGETKDEQLMLIYID